MQDVWKINKPITVLNCVYKKEPNGSFLHGKYNEMRKYHI
ncbi:hypothetical protein SAMN02910358_00504 [Lachnospiraceae bacterium XBB1006]|nr:hypothetical protein SAMN02910358_00504 [Lachnospiraceae bacterium XBB1006]